MFARLILALLLVAFAVPSLASASCHDAPATMPHHGRHHAPRPDEGMAAHMCVGCIPPLNLAVRAVATPLPVLAPDHARRTVAFPTRPGLPPALPPPRDA